MCPSSGLRLAGDQVLLRDRQATDVDHYLRWLRHGEWRQYDAPWESGPSIESEEEKASFRARFLADQGLPLPVPRSRAIIQATGGWPLGWVNRYKSDRFPDAWSVGIDICEDAFLNRGFGTEALRLWIDYLFRSSGIHRIGLSTWSFNPRMMRVAEKLGFRLEGTERELIEWQGQRVDRINYGILRREWNTLVLGSGSQRSHPRRGGEKRTTTTSPS